MKAFIYFAMLVVTMSIMGCAANKATRKTNYRGGARHFYDANGQKINYNPGTGIATYDDGSIFYSFTGKWENMPNVTSWSSLTDQEGRPDK